MKIITVARPHPDFPANLREKNSARHSKKFHKVILSIFKGFGKEIFYSKTKFTIQKIYLLFKLPLKKLMIDRKCF